MYFCLGGVAVWRETPAANGIFCGQGEKSMAGFDLGGCYGPVGLNGNEKNDLSADVHAAGKFGVDRSDASHDGSMRALGVCRCNAESEASDEEKTDRGAERNDQR